MRIGSRLDVCFRADYVCSTPISRHSEAHELLPGLDHKVTALNAALLLAAVVAAPRPADAPLVVVTLAKAVMQDIEAQRKQRQEAR